MHAFELTPEYLWRIPTIKALREANLIDSLVIDHYIPIMSVVLQVLDPLGYITQILSYANSKLLSYWPLRGYETQ